MNGVYLACVPDRVVKEVMTYVNRGVVKCCTKETESGYTEIYSESNSLEYADYIAERSYILGVMDVLIMKTSY